MSSQRSATGAVAAPRLMTGPGLRVRLVPDIRRRGDAVVRRMAA